jgi:hypothetical protein
MQRTRERNADFSKYVSSHDEANRCSTSSCRHKSCHAIVGGGLGKLLLGDLLKNSVSGKHAATTTESLTRETILTLSCSLQPATASTTDTIGHTVEELVIFLFSNHKFRYYSFRFTFSPHGFPEAQV